MGGQIILMRSGGPAAKSPLGQRPQPDKRWIRMNDDIRNPSVIASELSVLTGAFMSTAL